MTAAPAGIGRRKATATALGLALAIGSWWGTSRAHVGSPDTWFEGPAGRYPVRVVVRAPGVVPGLAEIDVRVLAGRPTRVAVQPFIWNGGADAAPPPENARPVRGDPRLFDAHLWFMVASSYAVHVTVSGDRGAGKAIVPVQVVATRRLPMSPALGGLLAALGLFLLAGLLTFLGAAAGEGVLPPGEPIDARHRRLARVVVTVSAAILALALAGGRQWWNAVDRAYRQNLNRPLHAAATLLARAPAPVLGIAIDDPEWMGRRWTPLIPDHGKLMHLFLIREPGLDAMAHLHPLMRDSSHFESPLPLLPAGHYRVYADVVHESGFARTLVASLDLRPGGGAATPSEASGDTPGADPDDSWYVGEPEGDRGADASCLLRDGATIEWVRGPEPLVAGRDRPLRFVVRDSDGRPAPLEPYLGMPAHAVVTRVDGSVFAHLHPIGTVSPASQMALTLRTPADTVPGSLARRLAGMGSMGAMGDPAAGPPGEFAIPYGFPSPGRYRLWVQVRLRGEVETGVFDAYVSPTAGNRISRPLISSPALRR